MEQIKQAAFEDEMKKIAGETSEAFWPVFQTAAGGMLGGIPGALSGAAMNAIPAGIGALIGPKTKEEMVKQDRKSVSNVLLPFVGAYRLGRRLATPMDIRNAAKEEVGKMKEAKK